MTVMTIMTQAWQTSITVVPQTVMIMGVIQRRTTDWMEARLGTRKNTGPISQIKIISDIGGLHIPLRVILSIILPFTNSTLLSLSETPISSSSAETCPSSDSYEMHPWMILVDYLEMPCYAFAIRRSPYLKSLILLLSLHLECFSHSNTPLNKPIP